jgi:hypothetical protein
VTEIKESSCPFCDTIGDHQHEFVDVTSPECVDLVSPECGPEVVRLRTENARLSSLVYAPTHHEQGPEDADEVCDVCSYGVTEPHELRTCIANLGATHDFVNSYLVKENSRLESKHARLLAELAKAQVDKTHLEEGARILVNAMKAHIDDLGPTCAKWLEDEHARKACSSPP